MGFLQALRDRIGIRAERTTGGVDPRSILPVFPTLWVPRELRVTPEQAVNVSVVYACIRAISEAIASSPWRIHGFEGKRREVFVDDPLDYLLNQRPNPEITAIAFREALVYAALADGNGYAEIQRDGSDRPIYLWPLDSCRMIPFRANPDSPLQYRYSDVDGVSRVLDARDVFHLRGPVCVTAMLGDSVVGRAARSIALMTAAQRFGVSFLANGAQPTGVLTYPSKLDEASMKRIRAQVEERYSGAKNAGRPLLLEGGLKFEAVQADPSKALMHDTLVWSVEDIARYFGVPLVKLGVQAAAQGYGTNVSQLNLEWTRTGLRPWALRLEQEANAKLFPERQRGAWRETCIDMEWLTRGDAKAQAEADEIRIRSGVDSVNEVLERLGRNTIGPEGEIRFIGTGLQPLTVELLEIQAKQAEAGDPAMQPADPADPAMADPASPGEPQDPAQLEDPAAAQPSETASAWTQTIIAACLDRYGSKIRARKRNLGENANEAETKLAEARAKAVDQVLDEVGAALSLSGKKLDAAKLGQACAAVEAGVSATEVASDYWSRT